MTTKKMYFSICDRMHCLTLYFDLLFSSRPPILSSYVIDLRNLDEKIINVIDIQFLHGYYEPTIFILYEPLPTWAG